MGTVGRVSKPSGGTDWQDLDDFLTTHINGDLNAIVDEMNGELEDVNIKAAAGILLSKLAKSNGEFLTPEGVDDHAATIAEYITGTVPPDSDLSAGSLPTHLAEELQQMRYAIQRLAGLVGASRYDGAIEDVGWVDQPDRAGGNLLRNGDFSVYTDAAAIPPGWEATTAAPDSVSIETPDDAEGAGRVLEVDTSADDSGVKATLSGLKAGALYLVSARVRPVTTQCALNTSGAETAGSFRNLTDDFVSATGGGAWETLAGVIQTQDPVVDVEVSIQSTAAPAATFQIGRVTVKELGSVATGPQVVALTERITGQTGALLNIDTSYEVVNATNIGSGTGALDITVVPPKPGCVIMVNGQLGTELDSETADRLDVQIYEATAGSAVAHHEVGGLETNEAFTVPISYVNADPTPGTAYQYQLRAQSSTISSDFQYAPDDDEAHFLSVVMWIP